MKTLHQRGMVLISLLALAVIVAMMVGVMLTRGQQGMFHSARYTDGLRAAQAAAGGANHAMALLQRDNDFARSVSVNLGQASYEIHFDPGQPDHSVNNLRLATESGTLNYKGQTVPAHTADIVVVGRCGLARRKVRVVAQKGFSSLRSIAALGKVQLRGECEVGGVQSLYPRPGQTTLDPAPGGIISQYRSASPADYAIDWSGPRFTLSSLSRLETAPAATGGAPISPSLTSLFSDQIVLNGAADQIPDVDVPALVSAGSSSPRPGLTLPNGPGFRIPKTTFIGDSRYVGGNLQVDGDIVFSDGTLYVDGDLTINGGFEGHGSLLVSGNITVNGGNTVLQTNQPTGSAIMAGGDIDLVGLSADGYLDTLVANFPAQLNTPYADLNFQLDYYKNRAYDTKDFFDGAQVLAKHDGPAPGGLENYWISPIPGPTGQHSTAYTSAYIPALILAIKSTPGYSADPQARKVVGALEEMQYHFRHNEEPSPPFVNAAGGEDYVLEDDYTLTYRGTPLSRADYETNHQMNGFDDLGMPPETWTHEHLGFNPPGSIGTGWGQTGPQTAWVDLHRSRREAFFEAHPLDFSWLGYSSFQGILYARGDVRASTNFRIVGSIVSLGEVELRNGSELIFNEKYREIFGERGPVSILHYEEI